MSAAKAIETFQQWRNLLIFNWLDAVGCMTQTNYVHFARLLLFITGYIPYCNWCSADALVGSSNFKLYNLFCCRHLCENIINVSKCTSHKSSAHINRSNGRFILSITIDTRHKQVSVRPYRSGYEIVIILTSDINEVMYCVAYCGFNFF